MEEIQYKIKTFGSLCERLFCKPKIIELLVFIGDKNKPKAVARLVYNLSEGNISLVWFYVNKEKYPELKGIGKTVLCSGIDLLYKKYVKKYLLDEPRVSLLLTDENNKRLAKYYKDTYGFKKDVKGVMIVDFDTIKGMC